MTKSIKTNGSDRGQATGISNFLLAIVVGAVMTWIIGRVTDPVLALMDDRLAEGDTVGHTALTYAEAFLQNQPIMFLGIAFFSLLVLSIYQREMARI